MFRRFAISWMILALALPAAARTRPHYGGTLHVETEGDPWQRPDGVARRLVFDGLTSLDASGTVRPALATQWTSQDADHRWEFKLRPGVHFHDGTPMTSVNVVAALNIACPSNCPWTSVRAVGPSVVFLGDSPMPNLPAVLAGDQFLVVLTIGADGHTPAANIGTGPFQVAGSNNGVVTLTANESCWQGRPFVDSIEIRAHRAVRDQWLDLGVDKADIVEVPAEMLHQARQLHMNVVASPPTRLLVLQISDAGALANPMLRGAISAAVDRNSLASVIFQKQADVTASLLPQTLTGYAFLFPAQRDLNRAHELRGGLSTPALTLSVAGDGAMQLAAQRIALDLHEAGFNVQVVRADTPHTDLQLRMLPLEGSDPQAALSLMLQAAGQAAPEIGSEPSALFKAEKSILDLHIFVPLLDLPRACAAGSRARDLHLRGDGTPDLADVSLEGAQ